MATTQAWLDSLKSVSKAAKKGVKALTSNTLNDEIDGFAERVTVTSHEIVKIDFADAVKAKLQPKYLRIPAGFLFSVDVELSGLQASITLFEHGFRDELQKYAKERANANIGNVIELIVKIEKEIDDHLAKGGSYPDDKLQLFSGQVKGALENDMKAVGAEVKKRVDEKLAAFNKGQKDLSALEIQCYTNIAMQVIVISVVAAAAAASHGTITAFAAVGIGRAGVDIAKSVLVLATTCDQKAKAIDAELLVLKALLTENIKKTEEKEKDKATKEAARTGLSKDAIFKTAMETALGAVAGLLGVDTPSLKNCKELIEQHHACIGKIDLQLVKVGQEIQGYRAKINPAKPEDNAGKAKARLQAVEDRFKRAREARNRAEANDERFQQIIEKLSTGVAEWTQYVDTVVGATVDIAVGFGDFSAVIESFLSAAVPAGVDAAKMASS
jgi:hypothetical protein